MEHFRLGPDGRFAETQYQLISHEDAYAARQEEDENRGWGALGWGGRSYYPAQGWQQPGYWSGRQSPLPPQPPPPRPTARGLFMPFADPEDARSRARRDPDYFWGGRFN
jgi:hypothetical protein